MARHRKYQSAEEANPALDISSLIDVCFLLLIYFLVATTIQKKEVDVPLALPSSAPSDAEMPDIDPLFIKVDANGAVYAGAGSSAQLLDTDTSVRILPCSANSSISTSQERTPAARSLLCKCGSMVPPISSV